LISRSLGVEFGGAIGIVFYLAQAISVAMYVIGFTEAFVQTFPATNGHFVEVASAINMVVFICVFIGAGWTIKVQYVILALLAAALVSFYVGAIGQFDIAVVRGNLTPEFRQGESLFSMFALFFPAVTGIMAGANMSGDLRDPARSIPRGTLAAVAITGLIYLSQAFLLGSARPREELISNNLIVKDISVWPVFFTLGVFAATLSSALGSMMGAPRILQAFARDEVFNSLKFFAAVSGRSLEPRRATVVTFLIAQVAIFLGDLNAIAPIITMFFMITYGLLNLATFYESVTRNPSYRPTFRYCHWSLSLLGTIGCLAVMFLINWFWATISLLLMGGLYWLIHSREVESRWGDLNSGVAFERARRSLLRLEQEVYHPKNWRPTILALSGTPWSRPHLAVYGHWLTSGHGILSLAHVVNGDPEELAERRQRFEKSLRNFIETEELLAFPVVVVSEFLTDGVQSLIQCHGMGGLRPNTVLLGWPNDEKQAELFGATVRLVARLGLSILSLRFLGMAGPEKTEEVFDDVWDAPSGTIDVWWRGRKNGALMLLLAHLLHKNPEWRRNRIRMLRVVSNQEAVPDVNQHICEMSASARIVVEPHVVVSSDPVHAIQSTSRDAAVVILGFDAPEEGEEREFFQRMEMIAGGLPRTLFVDSAGGMELDA
jgi:amino acid transporter